MEWFVNKQSKMPLYLQLKDFIKYSISTGAIQHSEKLPTVHGLAQQLGVNFDTVRKAYKELEREGLLSTGRGVGTFVRSHAASRLMTEPKPAMLPDAVEGLTTCVARLLHVGKTADEIQTLVASTLQRLAQENHGPLVLFAECNSLQANEISAELCQYLKLPVTPVLLPDLRKEIDAVQRSTRPLAAVITTGFHMNEVRRIVGNTSVPIDFVMTNMSPETRRKVDAFPKTARFGFICRDVESRDFYPELLRAELGIKSAVPSCLFSETTEVQRILKSVDVLLVAPSVYERTRHIAPSTLPVFNIQDRVDPLSLKMLRDRVASGLN